MFKIEKRICDWITEQKNILFFLIISLLAFAIRYFGFSFITDDMAECLLPWFDEIKAGGGLASLSYQVGNYNLIYQTLIAVMTYFDIPALYSYKLLSVVFDYVLALIAAMWVCDITQSKPFGFSFNIAYSIVLFLPTVFLNSSFWGQCDAIYTAFLLLSLWCFYKEKYVWAFVFLGLSIAFKLQAVFILPFVICYYFYKKKFSISLFGITLLVFWASGIVAFVYGRSLLDPFRIYSTQANYYPHMWMRVCSFWVLIGEDLSYEAYSSTAIILTLILCGLSLYCILSGYKTMHGHEAFLNTACWFVWTCVLFLPAMHERYTYVAEILLVLLCFVSRRYLGHAFISLTLSTINYATYLNGDSPSIAKPVAFLYLATWLHFTYTILSADKHTPTLAANNVHD